MVVVGGGEGSVTEMRNVAYVGNPPLDADAVCSSAMEAGSVAPLSLRKGREVVSYHVQTGSEETLMALVSTQDHGYAETKRVLALGVDGASGSVITLWEDSTVRFDQIFLDDPDSYPEGAEFAFRGTYDVLGEKEGAAEYDQDGDEPVPSVLLQLGWEGREHVGKGVLAPPPLSPAYAVLHVSPVADSGHSLLAHHLDNLAHLMALNDAKDGGEWPAPTPGTEDSDEVGERKEQYLATYLENEEEIAAHGGVVNEELFGPPVPENESALGTPIPQRRTDLDFTERLYLFVKDAADREDMKTCMASVFAALSTGALSPVIHRNNHTALGLLLRDSIDSDEVQQAFEYWAEEPLECLVEIGIFYMQRNYSTFLTAQSLCTYTQIEQYLDPTAEAGDALTSLLRLHTVLDTCYLANAGGAPYDALRSLCTVALGLPNSEYRIPLSVFTQTTSRVIDTLKRVRPLSWRMVVTSPDGSTSSSWLTRSPSLLVAPSPDFIAERDLYLMSCATSIPTLPSRSL